jgi:uncharacterized protein
VSRPIHFEIHSADPAAAREFYSKLFGWSFSQWGEVPYWTISTGGDPGQPSSEIGIDGGLLPRIGPPPQEGAAVNAFIVTVSVADCQASVDLALASGGTLALPKQPVPGIGWLAYVKDPDGNILGMLETDEDAPVPDMPPAP